jgi:hypothetical protein
MSGEEFSSKARDLLNLSSGKRELKAKKKKMRQAREAAKSTEARARDLPGSKVDMLLLDLREDIAKIARKDGPVIVGPFTGEVGFELLYWIPIVRWAVQEFPELAGRLIVVSRGGVAHWWRSFVDCEYVDIFSVSEPAEYVAGKGSDKQRRPKEFDDEIAGRVREQLGIEEATIFHPSLLFEFYYQARKANPDVYAREVQDRPGGANGLASLYDPIPRPEPSPELAALLPDEFVAVRFYFRDSFPDSPENRRFAADMVAGLSASHPVVALNNGMELDEHSDIDGFPKDVIRIDHLMTPTNNLEIQSAVLGRAKGFVGTYGGLSYLAPMLQVPSVGFSSSAHEAASWHLALALRLFDGPPFAPLVTLRPADLPLLDVLPSGVQTAAS